MLRKVLFPLWHSVVSGVEHVHVNGRFKILWNLGHKRNLKIQDSRFMVFQFLQNMHFWNLKIQDSRFCWNLKIQDSNSKKLETWRFKILVKLEDSRFKILLKLEDSRFKILCETWRFKIHEAWSSRVRVWGEFHILRTLVVGRGSKAYSMCTRLLLDLS